MLALFSSSLFDWARAWGLTSSDSLPLFLSSFFVIYVFCFCFLLLLFCTFDMLVLFASSSFLNIFFLTYQKKKKEDPKKVPSQLSFHTKESQIGKQV